MQNIVQIDLQCHDEILLQCSLKDYATSFEVGYPTLHYLERNLLWIIVLSIFVFVLSLD